MKGREVDLPYLVNLGLHDALINSFIVNHGKKSVILDISAGTEEIRLNLEDIILLKIDMVDDFKNKESILSFSYDKKNKIIKMFTTSNSTFEISFKSSQVFI